MPSIDVAHSPPAPCAHRGKRLCAAGIGIVLFTGGSLASPAPSIEQKPEALRVCADPNNMPFSNQRQEGFENTLAAMLAAYRGQRLEYVWWPQRRGFIRTTLSAGVCDVVMGIPAVLTTVLTTAPYYRSSYVFVTRRDSHLAIESFDDARLRSLIIGVHVMGNDYAVAPPGEALMARGLGSRIKGFSILGDYQQPDPPAALITAVAEKTVDVAVAWGPLGGYFASHSRVPLEIRLARPVAGVPLQFSIAMGVRRGNTTLQREIDTFLVRHRVAVQRVLTEFHVPLVEEPKRSGG